jgi:hypothetical protein
MTLNNNGSAVQKAHTARRVKKSDFRHHLFIESYGVRIRIDCNTPDGIEDVRQTLSAYLPDCFREIAETEAEHCFTLVRNRNGKDSFYKNGEKVFTGVVRETALETAGSEIRRTIAEFAVGRVFIHAGAVGWKGRAILIPGKSFSGKTSLTAALVKRGALYYSDEYAILDEDGFVHPFPKTLSVRGEIDDYTQVEYPVETLGGRAATEKNRVAMVLITEYKPKAKWNPQILSSAQGTMEIIKNTIPIRANPNFVLKVLNLIAREAIIVKSNRGDVSKFADLILDFFEAECF